MFLFAGDNEEAFFRAAYEAISESKPDLPIVDLDGPVRGYQTTWVFALDRYTTTIRVFRASGIDANGNKVSGYYPEVSGGGTLIIRGPALDEQVYKTALEKFSRLGNRTKVSSLDRQDYEFDRDRWRLTNKPSLRDGGTIKLQLPDGLGSGISKSVTERLDELENLRTSGTISATEYEQLRKKILNEL